MNALAGFNDWDKVIVPVRTQDRLAKSIVLGKSSYRTMSDLGFRGVFRVKERRISDKRTNATTLEGLVPNLPVEIKIVCGFDHKDDSKYANIHVVLQGFTRDKDNNLVVKIDSPSFLPPR